MVRMRATYQVLTVLKTPDNMMEYIREHSSNLMSQSVQINLRKTCNPKAVWENYSVLLHEILQ